MKQYLKFNSRKLQIEFSDSEEIKSFMGPGVFLTFINLDNNKKWPGISVVPYTTWANFTQAERLNFINCYERE